MKLSFMLQKNCIVTNIKGGSRSKEEILRELVDVLYENTSVRDEKIGKGEILLGLIEREKQLTTSLGDGFAFPHARFNDMKGFYILLGVCPEGVEFNSLDDKITNFFILTIVPNSNPEILLQARAAVMRFMLPLQMRKAVLDAASSDEIWDMMDKSDIKVDYEILAREIMRHQQGFLRDDMTLKEAARTLHRYHADVLPVLDKHDNFVKSISCLDIFTYGLPELFLTLDKLPEAENTSAFEKFFKVDPGLKLKNVKPEDPEPVISDDSSLIEVIRAMLQKKRQSLYVIKDKKLVGVIDRFNIIDKIIMN